MATTRILSILFAVVFTCCAAADSGDDFSNNLLTDLAPLLALFGERVTMQFMSQSMGWADNIILAMAPLGIITAIVSAIRVGGPSWLKAIIGRARENLAVAETDLMSSTSKEVCELWNGQAVVRCMGSAPVSEFICLLPKGRPRDGGDLVVKAMQLDEAVRKGYVLREDGELTPQRNQTQTQHLFLPAEQNVRNQVHEHASQRSLDASIAEKGQAPTSPSSPDIIIVRNTAADAPNISLNCHNQFGRRESRAVAVLATILQLGVLVYSGFATYYPTLKFSKDKSPIDSYAFPCTAVGTLVLVLGVLLCGHVVESSTEEERYQACDGMETRLIWLQQTKTVSDQEFRSFAIFAQDKRDFITTSRRAGKGDDFAASEGTMSTTSMQTTSADGAPRIVGGQDTASLMDRRSDATSNNDHSIALELKTILGTIVSLCGFIVQFIGLRGMHWSASVAQLGAVLVMTSLRAWVRRGLAKSPRCQPLSSGFELDWFAMTLGDLDRAPWYPSEEGDEERHGRPCWDGSIATGEDAATYEPLQEMESEDHGPQEQRQRASESRDANTLSQAHKVMVIRRDLGEVADWRGPASAEAIALARSIEITMDALFKDFPAKNFIWSLRTRAGDPIQFRLERSPNRTWKAYADEIEAALSLWLYSAREQEQDHDHDHDHQRRYQRKQGAPKDDAWLRVKGSPAKRGLRLLGPYTEGLYRDLRWWTSDGAARVIKVHAAEAEDTARMQVEPHRIVGSGNKTLFPRGYRIFEPSQTAEVDATSADDDAASVEVNQASADDDATSVDDDATNCLLATEFHGPLKALYALDMFSSFMGAAAQTLRKPVQGNANIQPDDISSDHAWQSFQLRNDQLSRMAQDIQSTRLGILEDIYLCIIPPLSLECKLPAADAIVELARQYTKRYEQLQHWDRVGDAYLWLFRTAKTFPEQSGIYTKATAVLMDYLRQVTAAIELREAQREESDLRQLEGLKSSLEKELAPVDRDTLSSLMRLYDKQGRGWKCELLRGDSSAKDMDTRYQETFNFTRLHHLSQTLSSYNYEELARDRRNVDATDIHGWTPLHYAARKGSAMLAGDLLHQQADVNARDLLDWTPLHYACQEGDASTVMRLFREGADINAQGRDGVSPLHCAAVNGHRGVVRLLIEAGVGIDIQDASGNTPLLSAVYEGHEPVINELWPSVNKMLRDHHGRTALHLASAAGLESVVKLLLDLGADQEARDRSSQTPLHYAAKNGHGAMVQLLIEQGADENAEDGDGMTLLLLASTEGKEMVVRLLIERGADKNAKDFRGATPLHHAARKGHETVARLLLEQGADKNAMNSGSQTPLHCATENGHQAVVKLLLDLGADKEARDHSSQTPLHYAAAKGCEPIIRLLVERGASMKAENDIGRTPLHIAAAEGYGSSVRLLVELGASMGSAKYGGRMPLAWVRSQGVRR